MHPQQALALERPAARRAAEALRPRDQAALRQLQRDGDRRPPRGRGPRRAPPAPLRPAREDALAHRARASPCASSTASGWAPPRPGSPSLTRRPTRATLVEILQPTLSRRSVQADRREAPARTRRRRRARWPRARCRRAARRPGARSPARARSRAARARTRRGRSGRTGAAGPPGRRRSRDRARARRCASTRTSTTPAGRRVLARVVEQVVDRAREPLARALDDRGLQRRPRSARRGACRRARATASRDQFVEPHVLALAPRLVAARELDQVGDEHPELGRLLLDVGQQPRALVGRQRVGLRQHLDVRAQARDRRAQLVRGVGDELALGGDRALERVEHRVEVLRPARRPRRGSRPRSGARGPRWRRCGARPR